MLLTAFIDLVVPQGCKDIFNVCMWLILKSRIKSDRKSLELNSENNCNKIRICVKQASVQDHLQRIQLCFGEAGEEGANLIWDLQLEKSNSWNTWHADKESMNCSIQTTELKI